MITYSEVYDAFLDCYRNKKKSRGAMEFLYDYQRKLRILTEEINNRTYQPSTSKVFIITDPKVREIFAADFRDRIIHHLIIRELLPLFRSYFIPESFSCMPGRGTLYGIKTIASYMDQCLPGWYVMKMDMKSFFMTIRKSLLAGGLEEFIRANYKDQRKLEDLVWLTRIIVLHDPTKDCIRVGNRKFTKILPPEKSLFYLPPDKGLPIGNYSSQMFANFYLTPLDYFIKYQLGINLYGRYVDDFVMFGPKDLLMQSSGVIRSYAREVLDVQVSESKFYLQPYPHGVKFLGSMIMPGRIYAGNRVRGLLEHQLHERFPGRDISRDLSVFNSYLGLLGHYSSYNIRHQLLSQLPNGWDLYVSSSPDCRKLSPCTL